MKNDSRNESKKGKIGKVITLTVLIILFFIEASIIYVERLTVQKVEADKINESVSDKKIGTDELDELPDKEIVENIDVEKPVEEETDEVEPPNSTDDQKIDEDSENSWKDKSVSEQIKELDKGYKVAYLTFDDGPSRNVTPKILDILYSYNIKATFFVVGKQAEKNPDILRRIYEEGHAIGNHTYTHNYAYLYKNVNNFYYELKVTERVLKNILGEDFETKLMRFPGGSFGAQKAPFRKFVVEKGYNYIDWNSLNGDAEGDQIPADKLIKRFKSTFDNQQTLVILMHDTDAKETTVKALPAIIEFLIEKGYQFATL
jgi:peptidoglycan/xylan/chitin deacetylase (PgdA/CDA1 family)